MALFSFSLLSLFFLSLFNLFCFLRLCQRVVVLNFLDIKVTPNNLLFSQRERERERERERVRESSKSSCEGVVGWCDGAG